MPIDLDRRGPVAILTLNRPEALNALSPELLDELEDRLDGVERSTETQAVVITGAGTKAFSAGADIGHMQTASALEARSYARRGHELTGRIEEFPKPVIAAAHGPVAGGGLSLAVACDFVVAAEEATFLSAHTKLGTSPDGGLTWSLTRLIGQRRALDMILANTRIDAATALPWGLVSSVVPATGLEASAVELAKGFEQASPGATAAVKRLVAAAAGQSYEAQLDAEMASFIDRSGTADFREGITAFVERRPARFPG